VVISVLAGTKANTRARITRATYGMDFSRVDPIILDSYSKYTNKSYITKLPIFLRTNIMTHSRLSTILKLVPSVAFAILAIFFASTPARTQLPLGLPVSRLIAISCWDNNMNGFCDLPGEDTNGDGICSVLDCKGAPGPPGRDGVDTAEPISCAVDLDCQTANFTCTINICENSTCRYYLADGVCATDGHCLPTQRCTDCACVDTCDPNSCKSDGCVTRECILGVCEELQRNDGCCGTDDVDCLGTSQVYYFMSGVYTDNINSKTPDGPIVIEGVEINNGSLNVPGGFYSYMPIFANAGINLDTITPYTSGAGVSVDGVLLKSNAIVATGSSTIASLTVNSSLTVTGSLSITSVLDLPGGLTTDTINEHTTNAGVTVAGVLLKTSAVSADSLTSKTSNGDLSLSGAGAGNVVISDDSLKTNTIAERTASSGVTVASVLLKSGTVTATGGTSDFSLINVTTGINFPTSGGSASVLDFHETVNISTTLVGAWASGQSVTITCTRISNAVTIGWTETLATASCTAGALITTNTAIPSLFLPTSNSAKSYLSPTIIQDNGNIIPSIMKIQSNGTITWYAGNLPSSGGFSCSSSTGSTGLPSGSVHFVYDQQN
jgi:hypothetical protein